MHDKTCKTRRNRKPVTNAGKSRNLNHDQFCFCTRLTEREEIERKHLRHDSFPLLPGLTLPCCRKYCSSVVRAKRKYMFLPLQLVRLCQKILLKTTEIKLECHYDGRVYVKVRSLDGNFHTWRKQGRERLN